MGKWEEKELGEVFDVRDGTHDSPKYQETGFPLVTSKNLINGKIDISKIKYISKNDFDNINKRSKVDIGDVLFAMIGTIGNPVCIIEDPNFAIKNVALFKQREIEQDSMFLAYYLGAPSTINKMLKEAKGATQKFVGLGYLRKFKIPLPPLSKQKQIVSKLDTLFSRIDKSIALLKENIQHTKDLMASVLDGEFKKIKTTSKTYRIEDFFDLKTGGTPSRTRADFFGGDVRWLVSGDINKEEIFECEGRITTLGLNNSNARLLPINSVMIALNGQGKTRGTVAMLRVQATCNQSLVAMIIKDENICNPDYLYWNLKSRYIEIRMLTGLNERRGLNMSLIRNIQLPIPSIEIQNKIIIKAQEIYKKQNTLLKLYDKKLNHLQSLKSSLLDMAFKGELV